MAMMIFKSLVDARKAGSLGFAALGCGGPRDSGIALVSSDPLFV